MDYTSACVAARLSWGSRLTAASAEDRSYAMLGILGVFMVPRYGEGEHSAFRRLQETILKNSYDESLFAWSYEGTSCNSVELSGLLAPSIECFRCCADVEIGGASPSNTSRRFTVVENGIEIAGLPKLERRPKICEVVLQCGQHVEDCVFLPAYMSVMISLNKDMHGNWKRRHHWLHTSIFSLDPPKRVRKGSIILVPHDN